MLHGHKATTTEIRMTPLNNGLPPSHPREEIESLKENFHPGAAGVVKLMTISAFHL